jgi:hypothetical protein
VSRIAPATALNTPQPPEPLLPVFAREQRFYLHQALVPVFLHTETGIRWKGSIPSPDWMCDSLNIV